MTMATPESTITDHEAAQIDRANATKATPIVFVHGLWLLPSSWDRWVTLFEEAGYVAVTPGWPDDPETVPLRPGSTPRYSLARGSARSRTTKRRSSAAWIGSR
jgi:hypothetical protein